MRTGKHIAQKSLSHKHKQTKQGNCAEWYDTQAASSPLCEQHRYIDVGHCLHFARHPQFRPGKRIRKLLNEI
jgi:hypothetical protein